MIKRVLILLFLVIVLTLISYGKEKTETVVNVNINNLYQLDISHLNITTKNISKYFASDEIVKIYPYVNPIYINVVGKMEYEIDGSLDQSIERFKNNYLKKLRDNGYTSDYETMVIEGIRLESIEIFTNKNRINILIDKYKIKIK